LIDLWWAEARKYQVLPLDNRALSELVLERPSQVPERSRYVYYPGTTPVPEVAAVNVRNRSHTITAEVEIPAPGAEGVLIAQGSLLGGWAFYVKDSRPHYVHNFVGLEEHRVTSELSVPPGIHTLVYRFERTGEHRGRGTLLVDGAVVGEGDIPRFTPTRFSLTGAGLACGRSPSDLPVVDDWRPPFAFTGRIERVVVEVEGPPFRDPEGEARVAISTQ
jgi:arylsulfatase